MYVLLIRRRSLPCFSLLLLAVWLIFVRCSYSNYIRSAIAGNSQSTNVSQISPILRWRWFPTAPRTTSEGFTTLLSKKRISIWEKPSFSANSFHSSPPAQKNILCSLINFVSIETQVLTLNQTLLQTAWLNSINCIANIFLAPDILQISFKLFSSHPSGKGFDESCRNLARYELIQLEYDLKTHLLFRGSFSESRDDNL